MSIHLHGILRHKAAWFQNFLHITPPYLVCRRFLCSDRRESIPRGPYGSPSRATDSTLRNDSCILWPTCWTHPRIVHPSRPSSSRRSSRLKPTLKSEGFLNFRFVLVRTKYDDCASAFVRIDKSKIKRSVTANDTVISESMIHEHDTMEKAYA